MKKLNLILSFCYVLLPILLIGQPQSLGSRKLDSLALVEFYHQTNGDYWNSSQNWLSNQPLEQWEGVTTKLITNGGGIRVSKIQLPNNNLRGTIDTYIDDLFYLESLEIPNNQINAMGDIFQTAPWSSQVNYYLPDNIDINNNALSYPDLEDNACWLAIIGTYTHQYIPTEPIFRIGGFSYPDHIPFRPYEEEPMTYLNLYPSATFQWFLDGNNISGATEQTYSPSPYGIDDMGVDFTRSTYFSQVMISHCGLDEVYIHATFQLTVYNLNEQDLGVYPQNQFIVKYDADIHPDTLAEREAYFTNTLNATLLKECPCGPQIQLWSTDFSIGDLETVRCGTESQSKVDTTELNFLFAYTKYRDIMEVNSVPDTSFLDMIPETANNDPVIVSINDSGVYPFSSHLEPYFWENPEANDDDNCVLQDLNGYDFRNDVGYLEDTNNHGTAVNGIIGRSYPKGDIQLMNTRFYQGRYGELFDAVCGMHYAMDNGAKVLNLSWGYYTDSVSTILSDAIARAADEEVLIVTSAGNRGTNNDVEQKWPANFTQDYDNMIVVGSYHILDDNSLIFPEYSNFSTQTVHLAAPGHARSTNNTGGLSEEFQGTSIATPFVSRAAATLFQEFPTLSVAQVKECILSNVIERPELTNRVITGGYLNFPKAHNHASAIFNALPLELISFSGEKTKNQNCKLQWEVQYENQLDYYDILKSTDGVQWISIATVFPTNSSKTTKGYTFFDKKLSAGTAYYRLRSVDLSGATTLSNIISIQSQFTDNQSFIYPNPVINQQIFIATNELSRFNKIEITNTHGQLVYEQILSDFSNRIALPKGLSGLYFVNLKGTAAQISQKIFIR